VRFTARRSVPLVSPAPPPDPVPGVAFEDRMATVAFRVVDGDRCHGCTTRACVGACPAALFVPTADGGILFSYEQCFECGACYLVCDTEGAITWRYPEGGFGVAFRRS